MRPFENPRHIMLFTLTFPIYPVFLGQRNKDTMLFHEPNDTYAGALILQRYQQMLKY